MAVRSKSGRVFGVGFIRLCDARLKQSGEPVKAERKTDGGFRVPELRKQLIVPAAAPERGAEARRGHSGRSQRPGPTAGTTAASGTKPSRSAPLPWIACCPTRWSRSRRAPSSAWSATVSTSQAGQRGSVVSTLIVVETVVSPGSSATRSTWITKRRPRSARREAEQGRCHARRARAGLDGTYLGTSIVDALDEICARWPAGAIDEDFKAPVVSDRPALLLSGSNDPITPPDYAARVAATLERSTQLVGDGQGHGIVSVGCVPRLLRAFLERPEQAIDADCLAAEPPTPFFLSLLGPAP